MNQPPTTFPPRPKITDPDVIADVAKKLAPSVLKWCQEGPSGGGEEMEQIEGDLKKILRYHGDGYDLARELDGQYDPDAALVEILDKASSLKHGSLRERCIIWVSQNKLLPPPLNMEVTSLTKKDAGVGIIMENYPDGRSVVCFEKLGHIKKGAGINGSVIEWEYLVPQLNPTEATPPVQPS